MIWLDRAVLGGLDRSLSLVLNRREPGFRDEFDRSLAVARRHRTSARRRIAISDDQSALPQLTQMLAGIYLLVAAALSVLALLVLPDAGTPHAAWWSALAAGAICPWLGQAVWHGLVNSARMHRTADDQWLGTITDAPLVALVLDGLLAVGLWVALK